MVVLTSWMLPVPALEVPKEERECAEPEILLAALD
jgi:hypothetical protein